MHQCSENFANERPSNPIRQIAVDQCRSLYKDSAFQGSFLYGDATNRYNVYPIFIGNWNVNQRNIIKNFLGNVGASPWYFKMMNKMPTDNLLQLQAETLVPTGEWELESTSNQLSSLQHDYLENREAFLANFKDLPTMKNKFYLGPRGTSAPGNLISDQERGIFIYLFAADAVVPLLKDTNYRSPSWYSDFCGTHTYSKSPLSSISSLQNKRWIMAYYPTANTNLACIPSALRQAPNGDRSLDAMINVIAHELIETTSGYDIGNKCVYNFGNIKTDGGVQYTERFGNSKYFIQQNFNFKTETCMNG